MTSKAMAHLMVKYFCHYDYDFFHGTPSPDSYNARRLENPSVVFGSLQSTEDESTKAIPQRTERSVGDCNYTYI
jgi:hypothetical protein